MKIAFLSVLALATASWPLAAVAGPRSSASYAVPAESIDAGGAKAASVNYSNDGSIGGIGGVGTTAVAPALTAKHSYIGQLYEVTNLVLFAQPTTVNEGTTSQLTALGVLDDASLLTLANTQVAWSVVNGPISSINASGLATAAIVYQNTPATVRGDFSGKFGTLGLTVVNVGIDNFGSYAGDGIDDAWQVFNFGLNNPNAGPLNDPDGDGQNNFFEYTAGTIPIDAFSKFNLSIAQVVGQPNQKNVVFSPRFPSRTYTVQLRTNLISGSFAPLGGTTTTDLGAERTVTDLNATDTSKFYRVQITFP